MKESEQTQTVTLRRAGRLVTHPEEHLFRDALGDDQGTDDASIVARSIRHPSVQAWSPSEIADHRPWLVPKGLPDGAGRQRFEVRFGSLIEDAGEDWLAIEKISIAFGSDRPADNAVSHALPELLAAVRLGGRRMVGSWVPDGVSDV